MEKRRFCLAAGWAATEEDPTGCGLRTGKKGVAVDQVPGVEKDPAFHPHIPPSSRTLGLCRGRGRGGPAWGNSSRWPRQPPRAKVSGRPPSGPATHLAPLVNTPVSNNKGAGRPNPGPDRQEPRPAPRRGDQPALRGLGEGVAGGAAGRNLNGSGRRLQEVFLKVGPGAGGRWGRPGSGGDGAGLRWSPGWGLGRDPIWRMGKGWKE